MDKLLSKHISLSLFTIGITADTILTKHICKSIHVFLQKSYKPSNIFNYGRYYETEKKMGTDDCSHFGDYALLVMQ